jgi:hypothetical protein
VSHLQNQDYPWRLTHLHSLFQGGVILTVERGGNQNRFRMISGMKEIWGRDITGFCNVAVSPFHEVVSPVRHSDDIDESVTKS